MSASVLLLACPDRPGIVAAVAGAIAARGANILDAQQHSDEVDGRFYQRIAFLPPSGEPPTAISDDLARLAPAFDLDWSIRPAGARQRVVILASRPPHALADLLVRARTHDLDIDVVAVMSDRPDHAPLVEALGVAYEHHPIADRAAQEQALAAALQARSPDLVILARYMRVLPGWLVAQWAGRMINIHHSFLPAFVGAEPYRQAHDRGVKIIGATAHYVTEVLDAGPIIEQDVVAVTHRDSPQSLARRGRDLETIVLARAIRAHIEHRVLISGPRTIVFT